MLVVRIMTQGQIKQEEIPAVSITICNLGGAWWEHIFALGGACEQIFSTWREHVEQIFATWVEQIFAT